MTREEAIKRLKEILTEAVEYEDSVCYVTDEDREPLETAIKALEQESLCDRLAREYISKVKYCDECFASTFCTINGLRNSRVPQDYCIENIKKYFENKASLTGSESEEV